MMNESKPEVVEGEVKVEGTPEQLQVEAMQKELAEAIKSPIVQNVRAYFTRTGKLRTDKLRPIILHDNRNKGSYYIGKNAMKRAKKEMKKK
jgi:hypothetical protein